MTKSAHKDSSEMAARYRLLQVAAELFALKGYAMTRVREIVAAASVTKPVLYYYFKNKEGIYLELMRDSMSKFDAFLEESKTECGGVIDRIFSLCDRLMLLLMDNIQVARIIYAFYYGPPQGAPQFDMDVFHNRLRDSLRALIEEGIRDGVFRRENATDMSWAVLGAVDIAIGTELSHPDIRLGRDGLQRVLTITLDGLKERDTK